MLGVVDESPRSITETGKKFKGRDGVYGRKIKIFFIFGERSGLITVKPRDVHGIHGIL
jgi:hypothetical protein